MIVRENSSISSKKSANRFITIEGGEGVGKSLFLRNLAKSLLVDLSIEILQTREPGGTPTADRLRAIFNSPPESDPLLMESEFLIVSAARAQHTKHKILPALEHQWVISDRYADSSRVYQGCLGGMNSELMEEIIEMTTYGLIPDVTFLLDCTPDISMQRVRKRNDSGETDRACNKPDDGAARYDHASLATHEMLRAGFLDVARRFPDRVVILDASREPADLVSQAMAAIRKKF